MENKIIQKDLKIEILKKIDFINNYNEKIKLCKDEELDDIIDFIKNDIEKIQDLCLYFYCNKSINNNITNGNKNTGLEFYSFLQYISYPIFGQLQESECKCKYHSELNKKFNEMIIILNQIPIYKDNHYLFYHNLNQFKNELF